MEPYAPNQSLSTTHTKREVERELNQAIIGSHQALVEATTVFPFTLIPDSIIVDREKLTVAHRIFFRVAEVISIRIEDILNVTADVGPFFGSLKISTRFFDPDKPYNVNFLWRSDALKIKRIMQGYIIAIQKGIDMSMLATPELAKLLDELGKADPNDEI
ncbi:MAG TPA: hypothetical protein VFB59_01750 [Candidatus Saccharimonadales bacterium]|nr:hypothetical protein [Candidatus Saccharimonadales bacterium]